MIPFIIIKKILLFLMPLVFFYLLKKMGKEEQTKRKSHLSGLDPSTPPQEYLPLRGGALRASKSKIIDGEIVDERKQDTSHKSSVELKSEHKT